jgi:hypothetical protein
VYLGPYSGRGTAGPFGKGLWPKGGLNLPLFILSNYNNQEKTWGFCVIEFLTYYSRPLIHIRFYCLDNFKFKKKVCIFIDQVQCASQDGWK